MPLSRDGRLNHDALLGGEAVEVVDERVDLAIGGLDLHLDKAALVPCRGVSRRMGGDDRVPVPAAISVGRGPPIPLSRDRAVRGPRRARGGPVSR